MIWREPRNHVNDCYFCATKIHGYNGKYLAKVEYEYVSSVTKPLTDGPYYAVQPQEPNDPPETPDYMPTKTKTEKSVDNRLSQEELNDLIRDLDLPKCSAEILGSRLAEKNFLQESTSTSCYRNREIEFRPFFIQEADLLYCTDVSGLMEMYGIVYNAKEWRLFIDSSKVSLKVVLLHNGNKHASIPIGHSSTLKETYDNMDIVLKKINYSAHKWLICGDLKIISILLGQQGGFTLNPCYLCQWNSRERASHWTKVYEKRMLCTSQRNVKHKALVDPQDVIIPPLHIKLGIMKQFTKALPYDGPTYKFIRKTFPKLSDAKIKEGIFTGPDIRKLTKNADFERVMTTIEKKAWMSFKDVIKNFLGNRKSPNYKAIVRKLLINLRLLGINMSYKIHFLHAHLNHFPKNLGDLSEEQGERFHQDIKVMETRYKGRWGVNMMADYCWMLKRDGHHQHKRTSLKRSFNG